MNNKALLVVIAIVLVGILGVMVVQYNQRQETPMEQISDSVNEAAEEIGDEVDDATTN